MWSNSGIKHENSQLRRISLLLHKNRFSSNKNALEWKCRVYSSEFLLSLSSVSISRKRETAKHINYDKLQFAEMFLMFEYLPYVYLNLHTSAFNSNKVDTGRITNWSVFTCWLQKNFFGLYFFLVFFSIRLISY